MREGRRREGGREGGGKEGGRREGEKRVHIHMYIVHIIPTSHPTIACRH